MTGSKSLPRDDTVPEGLIAFLERFRRESSCRAFLYRWKYPGGFRCPRCGGDSSWSIETRGLDECRACGHQTSLTANTVMHGSRKPLRLWFAAIYLWIVEKGGIAAADLARQLGLSYPTAWTWLHKLRSAVGRRTAQALRGLVEIDETYVMGERPGSGGGRPPVGPKVALVVGAIESADDGSGFGRVRPSSEPGATKVVLRDFVSKHVERDGTHLIADGYRSYRTALAGYSFETVAVSRSELVAHQYQPGIHRVFSLLKRMLRGTFQCAVRAKHLESYLADFEFRFNRRHSESRALLFQRALSYACLGPPPTQRQIVERDRYQLPERT